MSFLRHTKLKIITEICHKNDVNTNNVIAVWRHRKDKLMTLLKSCNVINFNVIEEKNYDIVKNDVINREVIREM